jgi:hypothetical protein
MDISPRGFMVPVDAFVLLSTGVLFLAVTSMVDFIAVCCIFSIFFRPTKFSPTSFYCNE